MKKEFEDDDFDDKKEFGNTLDYYNDELSRKAVGKLFDDDGTGEIAASIDDDGQQNTPPKQPERPISNHFYEESRTSDDGGGIVRGFEPERQPSRRGKNSDEFIDSFGSDEEISEREKYRRQFLNDMERDSNRKIRKSVDVEDEEQDAPASARRVKPGRVAPGNRNRKKDDDFSEEFENAEKRYSKRVPSYEDDRKSTYTQGKNNPYRTPDYSTSDKTAASVLSLPIFKVIGAAFLLFLIILIFMVIRMNSLSKELKAFEEAGITLDGDNEDVDALREEIDSLERLLTAARTENTTLKLELQQLTGEGLQEDGEGDGATEGGVSTGEERTYTVVSGDTLYGIAANFYSNPMTGVDIISNANNLTGTNISPGQVLKIPSE